MELDKLSTQSAEKLKDLTEQHVFKILVKKAVPAVKQVLIESYELNLNDVVANPKSKTRPEDYEDDFIDLIEDFVYVEIQDGRASFIVPDMLNLKFSGRTRVIKNILEGTAGSYLEITAEEYDKIFPKESKIKLARTPLDSDVTNPKKMVFLIRKSPAVIGKAKELKIDLQDYPFSNTPPIDIFGPAETFVTQNMNKWLNEAVAEATKDFIKREQGAKV